jgi:SpoU rRNA methylase family enzyme
MTIEQRPNGKVMLVFDDANEALTVLQDLEGLHADTADKYRQQAEYNLAEYEDQEASKFYHLRHEVI